MWLDALDLVLQRLGNAGCEFGRIGGVSGAGMQHGTVFWNGEAEGLLEGLDAGKGLSGQLSGQLSGRGGKSAFTWRALI